MEITEFSRRLLGCEVDAEYVERRGDKPIVLGFSDDDEYINGTLVIPSYLAKGLEFDIVLVYNEGNENYSSEEERMLFYTVCTRALHKLNVYYVGRLTPLMERIV